MPLEFCVVYGIMRIKKRGDGHRLVYIFYLGFVLCHHSYAAAVCDEQGAEKKKGRKTKDACGNVEGIYRKNLRNLAI